MNNELVILPVEVTELAKKVSESKQLAVNELLNQVFAGTADWERQVDEIEVKGVTDKMSIGLAEAARKNVKNARLAAEKLFDAKRDEVQQIKAEYDLEDKLWLKAKQITQLKLKAIEEKAEWKATFVKRYEAEQKELQTQNRILKVSALDTNINRFEFENMSEQSFELFIKSLEQRIADQKAAEQKAEQDRIEKEKRLQLHTERERMLIPYWAHVPHEKRDMDFASLTEEEWQIQFNWTVKEKQNHDDKQEEIRLENERLKAEADAKKIELQAEKTKAAAELKAQQESANKAAQKAAADKAALEAQLKAKADAENKRRADEAKAAKDKADAEAKAAKAPKKKRLTDWVNAFEIVVPVGLESDEAAIEIITKFASFKNWALTQVEKI